MAFHRSLALLLLAGGAASLVACSDAASPSDEEESTIDSSEDELIGGVAITAASPALAYKFPNTTVRQCSAARVGPRQMLTAAHCLVDDDGIRRTEYAVGKDLWLSNAKRLDNAATWHARKIARVDVAPTWLAACPATTGCTKPTDIPVRAPYAPDVAVITFSADLPAGYTTGKIDTGPVTTATSVTEMGYGCEVRLLGPEASPPRLKGYTSKPVGPEEIGATGPIPVTDAIKKFDASYILTRGMTFQGNAGASLCNGDSGGPLVRNGAASKNIVGVNSAALNHGVSGRSRVDAHTRLGSTSAVHGLKPWLTLILPAGQVI